MNMVLDGGENLGGERKRVFKETHKVLLKNDSTLFTIQGEQNWDEEGRNESGAPSNGLWTRVNEIKQVNRTHARTHVRVTPWSVHASACAHPARARGSCVRLGRATLPKALIRGQFTLARLCSHPLIPPPGPSACVCARTPPSPYVAKSER